MNKIAENTIHIGDIVQLKAVSKAHGEKFPQMIVTEVVKEKIDGEARFKYHCIWFIRSKSWEFKNVWLIGDLVDRKDPKKTQKLIDSTNKVGKVVFLTNFHNEFEEVKDESGKGKEVPTKFCPPALTITGFENTKNQAPSFDNNGNVIREVPNLLVKCLYFNPISNKYSEIVMPKEVFIEAS